MPAPAHAPPPVVGRSVDRAPRAARPRTRLQRARSCGVSASLWPMPAGTPTPSICAGTGSRRAPWTTRSRRTRPICAATRPGRRPSAGTSCVAHSLGGAAATVARAASTRRGRDRLVLVDPAIHLARPRPRHRARQPGALVRRPDRSRRCAPSTRTGTRTTSSSRRCRPGRPVGGPSSRRALQNAAWDVRDAASRLTVPTHVIGSDPKVYSIFTGRAGRGGADQPGHRDVGRRRCRALAASRQARGHDRRVPARHRRLRRGIPHCTTCSTPCPTSTTTPTIARDCGGESVRRVLDRRHRSVVGGDIQRRGQPAPLDVVDARAVLDRRARSTAVSWIATDHRASATDSDRVRRERQRDDDREHRDDDVGAAPVRDRRRSGIARVAAHREDDASRDDERDARSRGTARAPRARRSTGPARRTRPRRRAAGTSEIAIATPGRTALRSLRHIAKPPAKPVASAAIRSIRLGDVRPTTCEFVARLSRGGDEHARRAARARRRSPRPSAPTGSSARTRLR